PPPPISPWPCTRLERREGGALAQPFESLEERDVARSRKALVEEHLRRRENEAAVGVLLPLLLGLIADAHRTHAAIAGEIVDRPFRQRLAGDDAIDRLGGAIRLGGRGVWGRGGVG